MTLFGPLGSRMEYNGWVNSLRTGAADVVEARRCLRVDKQSVAEFQMEGKLWYRIAIYDMHLLQQHENTMTRMGACTAPL